MGWLGSRRFGGFGSVGLFGVLIGRPVALLFGMVGLSGWWLSGQWGSVKRLSY